MKATLPVIIVLCASLTILADHTSKKEKVDANAMHKYFVCLLYRGDSWTPEQTDATRKLQQAHLDNIRKLAVSGELIMAGPFEGDSDLRGLFFFHTETLEQTRKLTETDPAIKAGRLRADIRPWWGPKRLLTMFDPSEFNTDIHE